jgi:hypothetical protein
MLGFNEPVATGGHEEEANIGREDEESPEHGVHRGEGDADEHDRDHEDVCHEGDNVRVDDGGEDESTQTPLT